MPAKDYFPVQKGLRLEYHYESSEFSAPAQVVMTVLRCTGRGATASAIARMTTKLKGQETSSEYKIAKSAKAVNTFDGIIIGGRTEFVLPAKVGAKWREEPETCEIKSVSEKVKTPAGQFKNCLKVVAKMDLEGGGHAERYYAPGVGLVLEKYCTADIQACVRLLSVSQASAKDISAKTVRRSLSARTKLCGHPRLEEKQP